MQHQPPCAKSRMHVSTDLHRRVNGEGQTSTTEPFLTGDVRKNYQTGKGVVWHYAMEIFCELLLSFASSVMTVSLGSCRIDILLPGNRLLSSSFDFSVIVNNLGSCSALVCASLSNLKKHILLFCLAKTFIAISCNPVYCSAEEFTWIFRFCLPVHALPMAPCTFPPRWHLAYCLLPAEQSLLSNCLWTRWVFSSWQIIITHTERN